MKRTVKKQFWLNHDEAQDLQKKAKRTCLTESALVRLLIKGYEPKERPDDRFYHAMKQVSEMGRRVDELAMLVRKGSALDSEQLEAEVKRWHKFQADVERVYLRPDQNVRRWQ